MTGIDDSGYFDTMYALSMKTFYKLEAWAQTPKTDHQQV